MKIVNKFLEILVAGFGIYLALIPHWLFYWHIVGLASLIYCFDRRRYADAYCNLKFIYGDNMTEEAKRNIIKRCYQNFVFVILESVRLPYLNKKHYLSRFEFKNKENLFSLLHEGRSVVLVSAHYGYWEALGTAIPLQMQKENIVYEMSSLGRLTEIDFVDKMLRRRREIFNVRLINKKGAFRELLKMYAHTKVGTGILIDQNIDKDEGIEMEFLGKRATQTTITSIISRRFGCALVPILIDFNKDYSKFVLDISKPIYCEKTSDMQKDIYECTQKQIHVIEQKIKENPSSWLWFHKRWKTFYKEIYNSLSS